MQRIPDDSSIFTAETKAVDLAFDFIRTCDTYNKFIIFYTINKYILVEWQTTWNNSIGNKFLDIKPTIGEYQSVVRNIRKEEVVLARCRLVNTRVTHSFILLRCRIIETSESVMVAYTHKYAKV